MITLAMRKRVPDNGLGRLEGQSRPTRTKVAPQMTKPPKSKPLNKERAERLLRSRGSRTIASIAEELGAEPGKLYALVQRMKQRDEREAAAAKKPASVPGSIAASMRSAPAPSATPAPPAELDRLDPQRAIARLRGELSAVRADNERLRAERDQLRAKLGAGSPAVNQYANENAVLRALLNSALEHVGLTVRPSSG
jgi:hypothetical protein